MGWVEYRYMQTPRSLGDSAELVLAGSIVEGLTVSKEYYYTV